MTTQQQWYKKCASQKEMQVLCELEAEDKAAIFATYIEKNTSVFVDAVLEPFFNYYRKFFVEKLANAEHETVFKHTHMIPIGVDNFTNYYNLDIITHLALIKQHKKLPYDKTTMQVCFTICRKQVETQDDIDREAIRKKNAAATSDEHLNEQLAFAKTTLLKELGEADKAMSVDDFINTKWNVLEQLFIIMTDSAKVSSFDINDAPPKTYKYVLEIDFMPYDGVSAITEYKPLIDAIKVALESRAFVCNTIEESKSNAIDSKRGENGETTKGLRIAVDIFGEGKTMRDNHKDNHKGKLYRDWG